MASAHMYQIRWGEEPGNVRKAIGAGAVSTRDKHCVRHWGGGRYPRTWNDISRIEGILILDETEAVHKLDFGYLTGAMLGEMGLDVGLSGCLGGHLCQR